MENADLRVKEKELDLLKESTTKVPKPAVGVSHGPESQPVTLTFDEWNKLAEKARANATPLKEQPTAHPVKSRGDRDLFGDLLDAESSSSVTSSSICAMLAEKLELAKLRSDGKVGKEVESLIKSTSLLCASTHFSSDPEATQRLNELRDKNPIVATKGTTAPTVLAGILRSLAVREIAITSNELGIEPNDLR